MREPRQRRQRAEAEQPKKHTKTEPTNQTSRTNQSTLNNDRVFAIYQIQLGWKTYKHYDETDELPNPRPTQPKKNRLKVAFGTLFSHSKYFFVGWD